MKWMSDDEGRGDEVDEGLGAMSEDYIGAGDNRTMERS